MPRNTILWPLKKLPVNYKSKEFIGFDIETRYNNKIFLLATMSFNDGTSKSFRSKEDFIHEMMLKKYRGKIFCASFMEFDALGIFRGTEYEGKITPYMRGSFIFMIKTYVKNGELIRIQDVSDKSLWPIIMLDTMSYAPVSVESLGNIINVRKKDHPVCFNRHPESLAEWADLESYCANDSAISRKSMEFFYKSFIELGIKPKLTIASTSMDDFKRNHLTMPLMRMPVDDIEFAFESFKGAMNGVFKRGLFDAIQTGKKLYCHDVNSMYGDIMYKAKLPHPNYMRRVNVDNPRYIMNYEGCSKVDIEAPDRLKYPLLPFRDQVSGRVIYPTGNWTDTYTHIELRKSLSAGYRILKVHSSLYSTATIEPFKHINSYYDIRKQLKKEGNPLSEVYKLLINAQYGKFGERGKRAKKMIYIKEAMIEELTDTVNLQRCGDYYIIDQPPEDYKAHCNPLWASYITAGARLKLWDYIIMHDPYYVDTDSIICDHFIEDSEEMGMLKLEMIAEKAFFLRSKFYMCLPIGYGVMDHSTLMKNSKIKIKGVPKKMLIDGTLNKDHERFDHDDLARLADISLTPDIFMKILSDKKVKYKKFMRFKESVRRGKMQNEAIIQEKNFDMEDTKRLWPEHLSFTDCHDSIPLKVIDGIREDIYNELLNDEYLRIRKNKIDDIKKSDFFDSKADDISYEDFLQNEIR